MTEEQKKWFENLIEDRKESASTLEKPSMRGIKRSIVEKYSDQAHFIYELLQNANDAIATKSSFKLTPDGLYFKHNGKVAFSVSNPETEDIDKENQALGHINSITAIANSNKTKSSIGKFGVGFKAVFQYTETPHIYDRNLSFKINRFIVPEKITDTLIDREKNETVFYFPFDKKEISKDKAYQDILQKLKKLSYPTLFLSNLQEITWKTGNEGGDYTKKITLSKLWNDIKYEKIKISQKIRTKEIIENIYLFTRCIENQNYTYSIGYFIDENNKLKPKSLSAFCFFPTKENTNLNFILHAPFLLTDSREGIKHPEVHNNKMVDYLAQLAADSLIILKEKKMIDDNIINIIPYKKRDFYELDEYNNLDDDSPKLFAPFYEKFKVKLQTEELLPSDNNTYSKKENAYWAESPYLSNLFSNQQLSFLTKNENAKWVFTTLGRTKDNEITDYIDGGFDRDWNRKEPNLIKANLDFESKITNLITAEFIQNQPNEWLHKFYEYLAERKSYQEKYKTKPIFKDKQGNAVAAFEKKGDELHSILFLPADYENSSFKHIQKELLDNKKSKEFIEAFGIKKPSLKDEIYNHILPNYQNEGEIDTDIHFQKFFQYYKDECPRNEKTNFIDLIRDKEFVSYTTKDDETTYRGYASDIYYPSEDLIKYFESKTDTQFLDIKDYYKLINIEDIDTLNEFIFDIGVSKLPRILDREITDERRKRKLNLEPSTHGYDDRNETIDKVIDGCFEILNDICENNNTEKSKLLWNIICKLQEEHYDLYDLLIGEHEYFYRTERYETFESTILNSLKNTNWIVKNDGVFAKPIDISINDLDKNYNKKLKEIDKIVSLLEFKPSVFLTEKEEISLLFPTLEEAKRAKRLLDEEEELKKISIKLNNNNFNSTDTDFDNFNDIVNETQNKTSKITETIKDLDDLQRAFTPKEKITTRSTSETKLNTEIVFDEDEEFAKGIEDIKMQLEIKKNRVDLVEKINTNKKYSYEWFKAYLKLLTTYGEKQNITTEKTISFQEIKSYKTDNKYYLLCGANSYISADIENAEKFNISLIFGNDKKENINIEGVSKKGQDLLIYCPEGLPSKTISRLSNVFRIDINFTPRIDLLERLYDALKNTNYIDEWQDIEKEMPALKYIYGPPGTGKTTSICNSINEILINNPSAKFLVLTPTNKASDVVCAKLLDINSDIHAVRLSSPTDPELEEEGIYRDVIEAEDMKYISVIASTIHRLPYFDIQKAGLLFQYQWDYVIFDESSMTGLHYITFAIMALFKANSNTKFIIAGDPKQIPPVVVAINDKDLENFDFQDENIYKMMELESFNPKEQNIRNIDTIENLGIQYRSVPSIGQLFSELSYSGLLEHHRAKNRKECKPLPEKIKKLIPSNITFIDIPLNKENSIYKVSKLNYSPYQTYCAILVAEIIKYFDSLNDEKDWTIGLIAPYKAQAILLNKLITSYGISENLRVYSDTVHGFQGDECDIVFFVCNPNNHYYSGHQNALLSKEYIYNVAISRAKDYLIIMHPYSEIPENKFINQLGASYRKNFGNAKIIHSREIEKILFNDETYIENNSYFSGHENVNVFGLSEMKYFIKSNDTAIDIQLRDLNK